MYVFAYIGIYVCVKSDNLKFIWKYKGPQVAKIDTVEGPTGMESNT